MTGSEGNEKELVMEFTATKSEDFFEGNDNDVQGGDGGTVSSTKPQRSKCLFAIIVLVLLGAVGITAGLLEGRGGDDSSPASAATKEVDKAENATVAPTTAIIAPIRFITDAPTLLPTLRPETSSPTVQATSRLPTKVPTVSPRTLPPLPPIVASLTSAPTLTQPMSFQTRFEGSMDVSPADATLITPAAIVTWEDVTTQFILRLMSDTALLDPPILSIEFTKVNLLLAASVDDSKVLRMRFRASCAFTSRRNYDIGILATQELLVDSLYLPSLQESSHEVFSTVMSASLSTEPSVDI
jgi:hypothetical protein